MQYLGCIFRSAERLALVPGICRKDSHSWSSSPSLIDNLWNEVRLMRMMKRSNWKLELVRKANDSSEIHGFVNVYVDLNGSNENSCQGAK